LMALAWTRNPCSALESAGPGDVTAFRDLSGTQIRQFALDMATFEAKSSCYSLNYENVSNVPQPNAIYTPNQQPCYADPAILEEPSSY